MVFFGGRAPVSAARFPSAFPPPLYTAVINFLEVESSFVRSREGGGSGEERRSGTHPTVQGSISNVVGEACFQREWVASVAVFVTSVTLGEKRRAHLKWPLITGMD